MDDSISEFAQNLLARAKAREDGILKRQENQHHHTQVSQLATVSLKATEMTSVVESNKKEPVPVSPSNKENVEDEDEEQDSRAEENENEDESEEDQEMEEAEEHVDDNGMEEEQGDEVLPLCAPVALPLSRTINSACPPSASPVSRKSRLSALANSINSWEDDLGSPRPTRAATTTTPTTNAATKAPKFSVSTPPATNPKRQSNAGKRTSCHQFVATVTVTGTTKSASPSPTKKVQSAAETSASPTKRLLNNTAATSMMKSGALSPTKNLSSPSPPVVGSPVRSGRNSSTPVTLASSPAKAVSFHFGEEPKESPKQVSPVKKIDVKPTTVITPVKTDSKANQLGTNLTQNSQGFVKQQLDKIDVGAPNKVTNSILNKKRMFEKDETSEGVSTPTAPKVSKTTAWPPAPLNAPEPVNKSQPQKFSSRKSLQPDPSELTVAQKAKLFERQQREQDLLHQKEQEVNQRLNVGRLAPRTVGVIAKSVAEKPAEKEKLSPSKAKQPENTKAQFYFGQSQSSSIPPPPPPLPPTVSLSPSKIQPTASKPQQYHEDEDEDMENYSGPESEEEQVADDVSPSALIAKSVKRIKVVQKDDKMYPSLTDIENTEAETDMDNETNTSSIESTPAGSLNSSMSTSSLGSFIQSKAQSAAVGSEVNTTMACRQIDECIGEALAGQLDDDTFMMESAVANPLNSSSPIPIAKPLMHTVSLYRKTQQHRKQAEDDTVFKTPATVDELHEEEQEDEDDLHDKVQNLEQQIQIQQKAIAQASKALTICENSYEFSNSTENMEGERVLLIATQKRSQLLSHISKLRKGKQNDGGSSPSKDKYKPSSSTRGTMRIDSIQLYPIKSARVHQDYMYNFIVILKHNENVYATSNVKMSASSTIIEFPNEFVIQELDPGFKVQVEVYALRTFKQTHAISHDKKYHIKNSSNTPSGSCTTPSKGSTLSHFLTPTRSSKNTPKPTNLKSIVSSSNPTSVNSVRSSNFTLQATLILNLSNLNKTEWKMSMVSSELILPNISMQIKCTNRNEVNYKGFLTVFSDVSGLGAWHRRWARLDQDYRLVFWTYPEDEAQDKPPVLTVSLSSCITPRVTPTPREVCARPNTFLLVTTREPLATDEESLVVSVHEKYTAIKNMFSADNRVERDEWIQVINKTLTNMRAWGIDQ